MNSDIQPTVNPSETPASTPTPSRRNIILAISVVIFIIIILMLLNFFHLFPFSKTKSVSKQVPVKKILAQGSLTAVSGSIITLDVYNKSQTFSIAGNTEFKQAVSGSVEKGDLKTGPSNRSSLRIGQQILVIANVGSTEAQIVYILR